MNSITFKKLTIGLLAVALAFSLEGEAFAAGYYNLGAFWHKQYAYFTWISGATTTLPIATYGSKGVGATTNTPGGSAASRCTRDSNQNIWVMGGYSVGGVPGANLINTLWEYTPSNKEWTWVWGATTNNNGAIFGPKGSGSTAYAPGPRYNHGMFVDSSANVWVFGGNANDGTGGGGAFNDLWKYTPSNSQWMWVSGADTIVDNVGHYGTRGSGSTANYPPARYTFGNTVDSNGNFWIFGGANGTNYLNDVWEFTPSTSQWTWVAGASTAGGVAVWGTKGAGSTTNTPSSRNSEGLWIDASSNLWIYGGANAAGYLNDLWKYTPSNSQWTWVAGASTPGSPDVYGTKGVGSTSNIPGGRVDFYPWTDSAGNFWLFGGQEESNVNYGDMNDLWKFTPSNSQWTWIAGASTTYAPGTWGTKGIPGQNNIPISGDSLAACDDGKNTAYIFGTDQSENGTPLNQFWSFTYR